MSESSLPLVGVTEKEARKGERGEFRGYKSIGKNSQDRQDRAVPEGTRVVASEARSRSEQGWGRIKSI